MVKQLLSQRQRVIQILSSQRKKVHLHVLLFLLIRWIHAERHLHSFFWALKQNPISELHGLADDRFATEEDPSGFDIAAVRA